MHVSLAAWHNNQEPTDGALYDPNVTIPFITPSSTPSNDEENDKSRNITHQLDTNPHFRVEFALPWPEFGALMELRRRKGPKDVASVISVSDGEGAADDDDDVPLQQRQQSHRRSRSRSHIGAGPDSASKPNSTSTSRPSNTPAPGKKRNLELSEKAVFGGGSDDSELSDADDTYRDRDSETTSRRSVTNLTDGDNDDTDELNIGSTNSMLRSHLVANYVTF